MELVLKSQNNFVNGYNLDKNLKGTKITRERLRNIK